MSSFCMRVIEIGGPSPARIQPRARLFGAMDELCASPILWVGGPSGSGKTALVASYLSAQDIASTWCHLATGTGAGAVVSPTGFNSVFERISQGGFLVIEDCHQIPTAVLSELATEWASGAPHGAHLILIGRGEPPAKLAPLVVKGIIAVLAASDLPFSMEEMRDWAIALRAESSALTQWHEKCGGWALGIARALEGLRRDPRDPIRAFEAAKQELFAYFAAEVFEHITPCERQILVSAALVGRTSRQMAEALSGNTEAYDVLARIAGRNGLLARTPGLPPAYQFMPLFREFLLARISDTFRPTELRALAVRATALLEKDPHENWLVDCELLEAYFALRGGDRMRCHKLLCSALTEAHYMPEASQACAVFPPAVAQLCAEALREGIAPESARRLIEQHRLPAPPHAGRHWPWPLKVYVLGRFRVMKADAPIRCSRRGQRKPLELLQALIAFGATEVPARALIDALWPDSEGDAGYHALESALYRLRLLLGAPDAVRMASSRLSLDRSQIWVDLWEFEQELPSVRGADTNLAERVGCIRQLYEGDFLQHESDKAWALKTRQDLRDRFLRCMRDAARMYESRNLWQDAVKLYQSGLELESLNEDLYRGLMVCHRELGDHSQALHAYRRCRELLTRFLGVPPNAKTQAVYHSVRERATCAHP
jgi:DNA-binding SARP family transcriptional activator